MAEQIDDVGQGEQHGEPKAARAGLTLKVKLKPTEDSDRPLLVNFTRVHPSTGFVYVDFGFLEPTLLSGLAEAARTGEVVPQSVEGKLAVRVTLGYDGLHSLYHQLGLALSRLQTEAKKTSRPTTGASRASS